MPLQAMARWWRVPQPGLVLTLVCWLIIGAALACNNSPPTSAPTPGPAEPGVSSSVSTAAPPSSVAIIAAVATPGQTATPVATPSPTPPAFSPVIITPPTATPASSPPPANISTPTPMPTLETAPSPAPTPFPVPSQEEVEAAFQALPWPADGLTTGEEEALIQLRQLASENPPALWNLLLKPWVQDGLSGLEMEVAMLLPQIGGYDESLLQAITRMPVLDTFELDDITILQTLTGLSQESLSWLLDHPTLAGGITDADGTTVSLLLLERQHPQAAAAVNALPWIRDGIDSSEENQVPALLEFAAESGQVFQVLATREWVRDGLNEEEVAVLVDLGQLSGASHAKRDVEATLQIIDMPFLDMVDGLDAAAVDSLQQLFWESGTEDYLGYVLSHPVLQDGIDDDLAVVVAALAIVVEERPELLGTLLDLGPAAVEKRVLQLPLRGEVTLSVLNVSPGTYRTMDILDRAVRSLEEYMGVPFPRNYVGLLVADATDAGGAGGPSGVITVDPVWSESEYTIAHEAAHVYWAFPPSWIAEGGAEFMTTVSVGTQFESHQCGVADNLSGLDRLYWDLFDSGQPVRTRDLGGCPYSLGRGLFLDLQETLGDEAFRQGFAALYLSLRDDKHFDRCRGRERGLCYVKEAFVANAAPEAALLAGEVIEHWYHGPGSAGCR